MSDLRLSDTPGITLADRCRAVLTDTFPDIQLESTGERHAFRAPVQVR